MGRLSLRRPAPLHPPPNNPMRIYDFLAWADRALGAAGAQNPRLDARLLVGHGLGLDRVAIVSQPDRILDDMEQAHLRDIIGRRIRREPVARILGFREFWGLRFGLNDATLEPRPDSETLIEVALVALSFRNEGGLNPIALRWQDNPMWPRVRANMRHTGPCPLPLRILDLGTGTGCLLLALLSECPNATGLGVDLDPAAVVQAERNARDLGLADRAAFQQGDWVQGLSEKFDLILCNPPYIASPDIPALMPEVRDHDPICALDGGADGLAPYRFLIPQMGAFLTTDGLALLEVGIHQAEPVGDLFRAHGFSTTIHQDLAGIDRCVLASLT